MSFGSINNMAIDLDKIFKSCGFLEINEALSKDLTKIVDWQKKLLEIDIEDVEPMYSTIDEEKYISEQDISKEFKDDIFSNAPEKSDDNFFLVPKVVKNN